MPGGEFPSNRWQLLGVHWEVKLVLPTGRPCAAIYLNSVAIGGRDEAWIGEILPSKVGKSAPGVFLAKMVWVSVARLQKEICPIQGDAYSKRCIKS